MNANLITDLEAMRDKLDSLAGASDSDTVEHEMSKAQLHVTRAIEWEKDRP